MDSLSPPLAHQLRSAGISSRHRAAVWHFSDCQTAVDSGTSYRSVCDARASDPCCASQAGVEGATDVRKLMDADIKPDDRLVTGQLDNGLRYVILPNKLPPQRFEAHLEIHAGSVDELPNEQGIAHLVEHVTFLGSQRREKLLGSGARANAYTDFHHTVFHVHSPLLNKDTKAPLLPQVRART